MTKRTIIEHGRVRLALHQLGDGEGPPLFLLHALRGTSADWPESISAWPGPVFALDFCGHGDSDRLFGGGYYPELFAADADAAIAHLGDRARHLRIAGAGLGGYAALLLAGARPDVVEACLILDGEGLEGGPHEPDFDKTPTPWDPLPQDPGPHAPDPALARTGGEIRPLDYVDSFARRARRIWLCGDEKTRPLWLQRTEEGPNAARTGPGLAAALRDLAA
jgi:pimeloyl-ACP methyl ester carboxylesterase